MFSRVASVITDLQNDGRSRQIADRRIRLLQTWIREWIRNTLVVFVACQNAVGYLRETFRQDRAKYAILVNKKKNQTFVEMFTDFQVFFHSCTWLEFAIKQIQPHPQHVATLLCEILMSENEHAVCAGASHLLKYEPSRAGVSWGVYAGIRRIPTSGAFWQRILTSFVIIKQGIRGY